MKLALAAAILIATITGASAQLYGSQPSYSGGLYGTGSNPSDHSVSGYTRSNGTYVAPHYRRTRITLSLITTERAATTIRTLEPTGRTRRAGEANPRRPKAAPPCQA